MENVIRLPRKYWGSQDKKTFLMLHGWQDNAGSFDTLIPLLPTEYSYLAIDLPGHGLTSHFPRGVFYTLYDAMVTMRRIQSHFKWQTMSLMGHSLGSVFSFTYSAVFPDEVDIYIGIDFLKPYSINVAKEHAKAKKAIEKLIHYDSQYVENAKPYKEEVLMELIKKALNTERDDLCKIMLKRGTIRKDGFLYLTRDPKVKGQHPFGTTQNDNIEMAKNMKCSVLLVKSSEAFYGEPMKNLHEVVNVMKENAKKVEFKFVPGTHHFHLETPQVLAPIIAEFLKEVNATSK